MHIYVYVFLHMLCVLFQTNVSVLQAYLKWNVTWEKSQVIYLSERIRTSFLRDGDMGLNLFGKKQCKFSWRDTQGQLLYRRWYLRRKEELMAGKLLWLTPGGCGSKDKHRARTAGREACWCWPRVTHKFLKPENDLQNLRKGISP